MALLRESKNIHNLLPYLCRPGQFFKYDRDDEESMLLRDIAPSIITDACFDRNQARENLKTIAQDKDLSKWISIALDEGAIVYMVVGKHQSYKLEFDWRGVQCPPGTAWEENHLGRVPIHGLDERSKEQGGWLNPPLSRVSQPYILIPKLYREQEGPQSTANLLELKS